jgi:integrase/recombinase XerC
MPGVVHLDEPSAVFEAMLSGWGRQQTSRLLADATIEPRLSLVRRFSEFAGSHPWDWTAGDVEDFTASLMAGDDRLAPSTIRGYHLTLRLFCDYLLDGRYGWLGQCEERFGAIPSQVCHDYNTAAHLVDYEGRPERRPFSYDELQTLFDFLDARVEVIARSGRKGALAALRDAQMVKTAYAFGLRRRELCFLDVADLRPNPRMPQWGTFGAVHVRYAKSSRGSGPRRRTVLAVPEFDWAIDGLRQWVGQARPLLRPGPAAGAVVDRTQSAGVGQDDRQTVRVPARPGRATGRPDLALPAALLRDPPDRVRLPRAIRHRTGRPLLRLDHRDLHLGVQRLQDQDPAGRAPAGLRQAHQ